jgi:hypothetical protein
MARLKTPIPAESDQKHFSFPTAEKALVAFRQACQLVEDRFFMDPSTLVKLVDRVVTVPVWFPYTPKHE